MSVRLDCSVYLVLFSVLLLSVYGVIGVYTFTWRNFGPCSDLSPAVDVLKRGV